MESSSLVSSYGLGSKELQLCYENVEPLLSLLVAEYPSNAGDKLTTAFNHKITIYETLTGYALKDFVDFLLLHQGGGDSQRNTRSGEEVGETAANQRAKGTSLAISDKDFLDMFLAHEPKIWFRALLVILMCQPESQEGSTGAENRMGTSEPNFICQGLLKASVRRKIVTFISQYHSLTPETPSASPNPSVVSFVKDCFQDLDIHNYSALRNFCFVLSIATQQKDAAYMTFGPALFAAEIQSEQESTMSVKQMCNLCIQLLSVIVVNFSDFFGNYRLGSGSGCSSDAGNGMNGSFSSRSEVEGSLGGNSFHSKPNPYQKGAGSRTKRGSSMSHASRSHSHGSPGLPQENPNGLSTIPRQQQQIRKKNTAPQNGLGKLSMMNSVRGSFTHGRSLGDKRSLTFKGDETMKIAKQKQHLKHFYELRDPKFVPIVDDMFIYYSFIDIARGVYQKYRILPYGWKYDIERASLSTSTAPEMEWFREATKAVKEKKALRRQTSAKEKKDLFLTEKTISWAEQRNMKEYFRRSEGKVDQVIDEFIERQFRFLVMLKMFRSCYVGELMAVARGDLGIEAKEALGISFAHVKMLFKNNFKDVINAQELFVTALEPLYLLQHGKIKEEFAAAGRAGILFDTFIKSQEFLALGFQPYNVGYQDKESLFNTLKADLANLPPSRRSNAHNSHSGNHIIKRRSKRVRNRGRAKINPGTNQSVSMFPNLIPGSTEVAPRKNPSKLFRTTSKSSTPKKSSRRPSVMTKGSKSSNQHFSVERTDSAGMGENNPGPRNLNFIELWSELAATKSILSERGNLGNILISPVQEATRYKLYFTRLIKLGGGDFAAKEKGQAAAKAADELSKAANDKIFRSRNVKEKLLGKTQS